MQMGSAKAVIVSLTNRGHCLHAGTEAVCHRMDHGTQSDTEDLSFWLIGVMLKCSSISWFLRAIPERISPAKIPGSAAVKNGAVNFDSSYFSTGSAAEILSYWLPGDAGDMPVCVSSFISVTYKVYGCHHFLFNQRWMDDINHYKTLNSPTELTGPQPRKSGFSFVKNHLLMVLNVFTWVFWSQENRNP